MPSIVRLAIASALAATALAHVDINYPLGAWTAEEEHEHAEGEEHEDEHEGVCGGATRGAAIAWGIQQPFVSLSGDAGQTVRVLLATTNSTSTNTTVESSSSFPIVLAENVTFSSSGNLCLPVNLPGSYASGSRATLYVEAYDAATPTDVVSSCSELVLVPTNANNVTVQSSDGQDVINEATGEVYNTFDYYCNNGTIAALDTCSCHCHGASEHCDDSCSADRVTAARAECAGDSAGTTSLTSSAPSSSASPTSNIPSSTGVVGSAGAPSASPTGAASSVVASFGAVAAVALGLVALQ